MNIFEEVQSRLSSKTRMRGLFRDVHYEDLERIIERMKVLLEEKKAAHEADQVRRKEKAADIEDIYRFMQEKGLSLEDLGTIQEAAPKPRKKRNVQKYTFTYETSTGATAQWHGATTGRIPEEFRNYLKRTGKTRSDCIQESAERRETESTNSMSESAAFEM